MGHNNWNSLPDDLKSATNVSSFKLYIKEYFFKKLGDIKADIYSYINRSENKLCTFLEFIQNRISIVSPFSLFLFLL